MAEAEIQPRSQFALSIDDGRKPSSASVCLDILWTTCGQTLDKIANGARGNRLNGRSGFCAVSPVQRAGDLPFGSARTSDPL